MDFSSVNNLVCNTKRLLHSLIHHSPCELFTASSRNNFTNFSMSDQSSCFMSDFYCRIKSATNHQTKKIVNPIQIDKQCSKLTLWADIAIFSLYTSIAKNAIFINETGPSVC